RRAQQPAAEIARTLRERADHKLSPPVTGPLSALTDVLTHGGDIKIPLGLPYEPDPQRVALALDFLTGRTPFGFVPQGRLRGIRLHATDTDQTWGRGDEIRGPIASLMVSALGRTARLPTLDGPGLLLLRQRLKA
ncbi:MAG: maleylpyruvate isomerase family mycothiol-dependent enzyme, partial [Mycobacterium sp.]